MNKGVERMFPKRKIKKIMKKGILNIVYKVTNQETKEIYIGITTNSILVRKSDQILKSKSDKKTKFYSAIATFGADNFKWEQIDTANSIEELAKKERDYIRAYNSKEKGLNSDIGGGIKKPIYQYNLEGKLVNTYDSLKSAGESIKTSKKQLSKVCLSVNKKLGDYYWTYDYVEKFKPTKDLRKKKVYQYSMEGELLKEYESVSLASKETKINKSSISKVCRNERKSSGGYKWEYA